MQSGNADCKVYVDASDHLYVYGLFQDNQCKTRGRQACQADMKSIAKSYSNRVLGISLNLSQLRNGCGTINLIGQACCDIGYCQKVRLARAGEESWN